MRAHFKQSYILAAFVALMVVNMVAERGTRVASYALVMIVLLAFKLDLGGTFVHPVCPAKARNTPRAAGTTCSRSGLPLRARERAAENRASPALIKYQAPPAVRISSATICLSTLCLRGVAIDMCVRLGGGTSRIALSKQPRVRVQHTHHVHISWYRCWVV